MPEGSEQRARDGLAICLRSLESGQVRLVFDDVRSETETWPQVWRSHVFYTHNDYDRDRICSMGLSQEQFAQIGEVVVARLLAVNGLVRD